MDKFTETIKKHSLIKEGDKILIGVSGGPDSMALLLHLFALKDRFKLQLHIAHLDHNLRQDSSSDALFVKKWAEKLNLPVSFKRLEPGTIKMKGSLEERCREARFDFFIRIAKKIKADKVALGHNLDDQAETILMRILRGTGLSGLVGISFKRNIRGVVFIRPLLETSRNQIEGFLKRKKIRAIVDSTNLEDLFFRNKIRHNLIPLLKNEYNKNIVEGLVNLAQSASYDYEYLDQVAKRSIKGNLLRLNLIKLKRLPVAILRLKIRQSIGHIQGDLRRIGFVHIKEIEDLIRARPDGSIVDLPKGISAQKTRKYLRFFKR